MLLMLEKSIDFEFAHIHQDFEFVLSNILFPNQFNFKIEFNLDLSNSIQQGQ
jgi:hypothetical protein